MLFVRVRGSLVNAELLRSVRIERLGEDVRLIAEFGGENGGTETLAREAPKPDGQERLAEHWLGEFLVTVKAVVR